MFFTSLGAATLLPFGSEPLFLGYLILDDINQFWLFFWASFGNIIGGAINYWCGIKFLQGNQKFNLIKPDHLAKAQKFFDKYGGYTLLFSWAPIVGDAFTMIAGISRYSLWKFMILMSAGKILRFLFLWGSVIGFQKFWG
jgi:membrane protein YqaA with SNARE-associated domain